MIKSDARFAASSRFCTDAATVPAIVNNCRTVKSKLEAWRVIRGPTVDKGVEVKQLTSYGVL